MNVLVPVTTHSNATTPATTLTIIPDAAGGFGRGAAEAVGTTAAARRRRAGESGRRRKVRVGRSARRIVE